MDINVYVLMTYGVTAVISLAVIGAVVIVNKCMNGRDSQDSSR